MAGVFVEMYSLYTKIYVHHTFFFYWCLRMNEQHSRSYVFSQATHMERVLACPFCLGITACLKAFLPFGLNLAYCIGFACILHRMLARNLVYLACHICKHSAGVVLMQTNFVVCFCTRLVVRCLWYFHCWWATTWWIHRLASWLKNQIVGNKHICSSPF